MKKIFLSIAFAAIAALSALAEEAPTAISLEEAIQIALSENASVKVADLEIQRTGYARKGTYASLFPKIDGSGSYQRTIKKQVMYMDFNFGGMGAGTGDSSESKGGGASEGIEMGRWNTWSAGVSASMPLVNAQLWESLKISDEDVELAVEKARASRIETVTQVKKAYYTVLLAKQAFEVYKSVYENAMENLQLTEKKYNAQRASELDLTRAKTTVANAIPNVYDSENAVTLGLWQLKAVMGVDLDTNIDVKGSINDYAGELEQPLPDDLSLADNSTLRQLSIQATQLAENIKLQQYANIPSLALSYSYSINAMTNDFVFKDYRWSPYSFVGLSLSIPIFNGGKRYHAIRQAKVQAAQMDIQRVNTERQLQIAVRSSLSTMGTATKSYASASSAVETAEKAYGIARQSYEVGRSTLTDLGDAQLALTQSRLGVCQAIFSYLSAKSDLEGTIGADFLPEKNQ